MYTQRSHHGNIPVFRGCSFSCIYCSFKRLIMMNKKCPDCAEFKPHFHPEALLKSPPKTKDNEFITLGLSSDISFMENAHFWRVLEYCRTWGDRTFLIQSKNPEYFLRFQNDCMKTVAKNIPRNVILGTTIESNLGAWEYKEMQIHYNTDISKAPLPIDRYKAMLKLDCRKAITIEPILNLDIETMVNWLNEIGPEFVYIGYANDNHDGKRLKLPEPTRGKTQVLIDELLTAGVDVREKTVRKAWYEK